MDRLTLSRIDGDLGSSEVAALCFLCLDVINRKRLEGIKDARDLFQRLEEKCLLENPSFLSQLLKTIRRADLVSLLETDSGPPAETDSNPILSDYRVMLYQVDQDMTDKNLETMKFLLSDKLGRRYMDTCHTALDVFAEMEKVGLLSNTKLDELYATLLEFDKKLASIVHDYVQRVNRRGQTASPPRVSMDYQRVISSRQQNQTILSISETQPSNVGQSVVPDAEPNIESSSSSDPTEYYSLTHNPRGVCMVINNEKFSGPELRDRAGTLEDERALRRVFTHLGFVMEVHNNLTAEGMRREIQALSKRNFNSHDVLVVCVLSHGDMGCVFGTDEIPVSLQEFTQPFTSLRAPSLAGKPKLFFIQACQGSGYQIGAQPWPLTPQQEEDNSGLEEDAGPVRGQTVAEKADFLLGMATVPNCKSFRNTVSGSIYIQELCKQLHSAVNDDLLSILTRVNREVSKGEYKSFKQMPEPKYTLTKKLVLKRV
ncbi:caspase-8 isoform X1 [Sparus aurata]|uniref:Caspase-8 n=1 Tax=Sparus aurata TaxID=8175 RepID=A0A671TXT9_SPAAU|nr:caspase-8-like isoform X1 [Sparus aurata]